MKPPSSDTQRSALLAAVTGAIQVQAAANGLPFVPQGFMQAVHDRAMDDLTALPAAALGGAALNSPLFASTITASFNTVMSQLSAPQKLALKSGLNPYDPVVLKEIAISRPEAGGSILARDQFGRTQWDRMTGGKGTPDSFGYGSLNPRWDSSVGVAGLTPKNFVTSPFAVPGTGLGISDIPAIQKLASIGFGAEAIRQGGRDRDALGLAGFGAASRESFENLTIIRRADPAHIKRLAEYRGSSFDDALDLVAANKEAEKAEAQGRTEDAMRARQRAAEIEERQRTERAQLVAVGKDPDIQRRIGTEANKIWQHNEETAKAAVEAGIDPKAIKAFRKNPDDPETRKAFEAARNAATLRANGDAGKLKAIGDLDARLAADRKQSKEAATQNVGKRGAVAEADVQLGQAQNETSDQQAKMAEILRRRQQEALVPQSATATPTRIAEATKPKATPDAEKPKPIVVASSSGGLKAGPV